MATAGFSHSLSSSTSQPASKSSKPFSISLSSNSRAPVSRKSTLLNPKKRPHSSLAEDSGSDHEDYTGGPQLLTGFDQAAGGAININGWPKEKAPLVIQSQKNRDWREESRRKRGKNILPAEVQAARQGLQVAEKSDVPDDSRPQFGLTFVAKKHSIDAHMEDADSSEAERGVAGVRVKRTVAKTEDEEAMEALLSGKKNSTLVIGDTGPDSVYTGRVVEVGVSDDVAFKRDVQSRPDSASLDDYAAVPVEEFGAALLRGMGWKEGEDMGKRKGEEASKSRKVERRAPLLGIGAKEISGNLLEVEGAWGKAAKGRKRQKDDKSYSPVVLKNARTGEMLTEDELKAKQEEQKKEEDDWRRRRDRNLAIDEERKAETAHRELDRDRDRESNSRTRYSSSRRDRNKDYHSSDYAMSNKERSHNSRYERDERDDSSASRHRYRDRAKSDIENDRYSSSRSSPKGSDRERDEYRSRRREEVY